MYHCPICDRTDIVWDIKGRGYCNHCKCDVLWDDGTDNAPLSLIY